jgi:hypothetical protein
MMATAAERHRQIERLDAKAAAFEANRIRCAQIHATFAATATNGLRQVDDAQPARGRNAWIGAASAGRASHTGLTPHSRFGDAHAGYAESTHSPERDRHDDHTIAPGGILRPAAEDFDGAGEMFRDPEFDTLTGFGGDQIGTVLHRIARLGAAPTLDEVLRILQNNLTAGLPFMPGGDVDAIVSNLFYFVLRFFLAPGLDTAVAAAADAKIRSQACAKIHRDITTDAGLLPRSLILFVSVDLDKLSIAEVI